MMLPLNQVVMEEKLLLAREGEHTSASTDFRSRSWDQVKVIPERPDTGPYRKACELPWARKPKITCFLAQGIAEAFL